MSNLEEKKQCYFVYVIELHPRVMNTGRFTEANPGYSYSPDRPPLYVGMTGRTPGIRFEQHRKGYKASRYTKGHVKRLRPDLSVDIIYLARADAERMEVQRADELRELGYAVWQN